MGIDIGRNYMFKLDLKKLNKPTEEVVDEEKKEESQHSKQNESQNAKLTVTASNQSSESPLSAAVRFLEMQEKINFVSTSKTNTRELPRGISEFDIDGNKVTVYNNDGKISSQVVGKNVVNFDDLYKKISIDNIKGKFIDGDDNTDESYDVQVNGEIDEWVKQGGTGDCWLLTAVLSLNSTVEGKQIIKDSIKKNNDGSVTVTFAGINKSYTISASEIKRHDTDSNLNDAYSNGDNDMLVFELAVEKLIKDIRSGRVKLDVPEDSYITGGNSIEGNFPQTMLYFLTGKISDTHVVDTDSARSDSEAKSILANGLPVEEIYDVLQNASNNPPTVLTFGMYYSVKTAKCIDGTVFNLDLRSGGHALAITNVDSENRTVTFVNPWNSTETFTMSWEEFAKMGIGMIASTQLDKIEQPENNDDIDNVPDSDNDGTVEPDEPILPDEPVEPDDVDNIDDIDDPDVTPKYDVDISGLEEWSNFIDFTKIEKLNDQVKLSDLQNNVIYEEIDLIKDEILDYVKNQLDSMNISYDDSTLEKCLNRIISRNASIRIYPQRDTLKDIVQKVLTAVDKAIKNSRGIFIASYDPYNLDSENFKSIGLSPALDSYLLDTADYYLTDEEKELKQIMLRMREQMPNYMHSNRYLPTNNEYEQHMLTYTEAIKELDLMATHLEAFLKQRGVSDEDAKNCIKNAKNYFVDFYKNQDSIDEFILLSSFAQYVNSNINFPDNFANNVIIINGKSEQYYYSEKQLLDFGFSKENLAQYFSESDMGLTMHKFLCADGKKISSVCELLDAIKNGKEITSVMNKENIFNGHIFKRDNIFSKNIQNH